MHEFASSIHRLKGEPLELEFHKFGDPPVHPCIKRAIEEYTAVEITFITDAQLKDYKRYARACARSIS
jgi:hypothetical protein